MGDNNMNEDALAEGKTRREDNLLQALFPVGCLLVLIIYGLVLRPLLWFQDPLPLEIIFIVASTMAVSQLFYLGYTWDQIQKAIMVKILRAFPTLMILFAIGLIIGSWMVSGTIPMLVYYGIKSINTDFIYVLAFLVPALFSSFTGTSFGSAGTIGVVVMGVCISVQANPGIAAGAIIGGSYFGDKMSPLSDTTNIAALATEVDLYDHIRSMFYTTIPSAVIAALIYTVVGFTNPVLHSGSDFTLVSQTLGALETLFVFHPLLLLPPLIVLYGSLKKKSTLPTLVTSSLVAAILGLLIQHFTIEDVSQSLYKGFETRMATDASLPPHVVTLLDRGGLYALNDAIIIALMVFIYVGIIDVIGAMEQIVNRFLGFVKRSSGVVLASLFSSAITSALTSNQYATSFIVGDAFKSKYDQLSISRRVLSRSLEDYGTMFESLVPWSPTTIFMVSTLGVAFADYWQWQLLSLVNLLVAPAIALLGIGMFKQSVAREKMESEVQS